MTTQQMYELPRTPCPCGQTSWSRVRGLLVYGIPWDWFDIFLIACLSVYGMGRAAGAGGAAELSATVQGRAARGGTTSMAMADATLPAATMAATSEGCAISALCAAGRRAVVAATSEGRAISALCAAERRAVLAATSEGRAKSALCAAEKRAATAEARIAKARAKKRAAALARPAAARATIEGRTVAGGAVPAASVVPASIVGLYRDHVKSFGDRLESFLDDVIDLSPVVYQAMWSEVDSWSGQDLDGMLDDYCEDSAAARRADDRALARGPVQWVDPRSASGSLEDRIFSCLVSLVDGSELAYDLVCAALERFDHQLFGVYDEGEDWAAPLGKWTSAQLYEWTGQRRCCEADERDEWGLQRSESGDEGDDQLGEIARELREIRGELNELIRGELNELGGQFRREDERAPALPPRTPAMASVPWSDPLEEFSDWEDYYWNDWSDDDMPAVGAPSGAGREGSSDTGDDSDGSGDGPDPEGGAPDGSGDGPGPEGGAPGGSGDGADPGPADSGSSRIGARVHSLAREARSARGGRFVSLDSPVAAGLAAPLLPTIVPPPMPPAGLRLGAPEFVPPLVPTALPQLPTNAAGAALLAALLSRAGSPPKSYAAAVAVKMAQPAAGVGASVVGADVRERRRGCRGGRRAMRGRAYC